MSPWLLLDEAHFREDSHLLEKRSLSLSSILPPQAFNCCAFSQRPEHGPHSDYDGLSPCECSSRRLAARGSRDASRSLKEQVRPLLPSPSLSPHPSPCLSLFPPPFSPLSSLPLSLPPSVSLPPSPLSSPPVFNTYALPQPRQCAGDRKRGGGGEEGCAGSPRWARFGHQVAAEEPARTVKTKIKTQINKRALLRTSKAPPGAFSPSSDCPLDDSSKTKAAVNGLVEKTILFYC